MTIKNILLATANLLEQRGWCQGTTARDADGKPVSVVSPTATSFCILGAINYLQNTNKWPVELLNEAVNDVEDFLFESVGCPIPDYNDSSDRTKEQVVSVLREVANKPQ
jgi:hypothetical protein